MDFQKYLEARGESELEFARRAGLQRQTVWNVAHGKVRCRIDIAAQIVRTSREEPAPCGGTVTYEDLAATGADEI